MKASISEMGMTSLTISDVPSRPRMTTTYSNSPSSGATTNRMNARARGTGQPWSTRTSQYANAQNIPMAPWAKLKMPDVE